MPNSYEQEAFPDVCEQMEQEGFDTPSELIQHWLETDNPLIHEMITGLSQRQAFELAQMAND